MAPAWPRRPRFVAGNWKMNRLPAEGAALAREIVALRAADPAGGGSAVAVFPPFTAIAAVGGTFGGLTVTVRSSESSSPVSSLTVSRIV